jgi:2-phospho-L-lactate guanylyltransferase
VGWNCFRIERYQTLPGKAAALKNSKIYRFNSAPSVNCTAFMFKTGCLISLKVLSSFFYRVRSRVKQRRHNMSNTWALVPLKNLDRAKQRLVPVLSDEQRRRLVLAMVRDVLTALENSASITKILLVSSEPEAGPLLRDRNVDVFYSHRDEGMNRELESAAAYALSRGADRALIIHGDLPFLNSTTIDRFVGNVPQGTVRAARCKTGKGTNLLLAPLPLEIKLKFGRNSHKQFVKEAGDHKLQFDTVSDERLGMDIDSPEDFAKLMAKRDDAILSGRATRAFLSSYAGLPVSIQSSHTASQAGQVDRQENCDQERS